MNDAAAAARYDAWYEEHQIAYETEVAAIATILAGDGLGLEVGVGTGRFASRLGIDIGVEPARPMARMASARGVRVCLGVGESLPFRDAAFGRVLFVTALCFVDDPAHVVEEAARVLQSGGVLVVADIDPESLLGHTYQDRQATSTSLKGATFHAVEEIVGWMARAGFEQTAVYQTLFHLPEELGSVEPVVPGHGRGGFVLVRGQRPA